MKTMNSDHSLNHGKDFEMIFMLFGVEEMKN